MTGLAGKDTAGVEQCYLNAADHETEYRAKALDRSEFPLGDFVDDGL